MTPEQKMAKQQALNRVKDAARTADQAWQAANQAQDQLVAAIKTAMEHATGVEVAQVTGRSRANLYRTLRRVKRV